VYFGAPRVVALDPTTANFYIGTDAIYGTFVIVIQVPVTQGKLTTWTGFCASRDDYTCNSGIVTTTATVGVKIALSVPGDGTIAVSAIVTSVLLAGTSLSGCPKFSTYEKIIMAVITELQSDLSTSLQPVINDHLIGISKAWSHPGGLYVSVTDKSWIHFIPTRAVIAASQYIRIDFDLQFIGVSQLTGINVTYTISQNQAQLAAPSTTPPLNFDGTFYYNSQFRLSGEVYSALAFLLQVTGATNAAYQKTYIDACLSTSITYTTPEVKIQGSLATISISSFNITTVCVNKTQDNIMVSLSINSIVGTTTLEYIVLNSSLAMNVQNLSFPLDNRSRLTVPSVPIPPQWKDYGINYYHDLFLSTLNAALQLASIQLPPYVSSLLSHPNVTQVGSAEGPGQIWLTSYCSCNFDGGPYRPCSSKICSSYSTARRRRRSLQSDNTSQSGDQPLLVFLYSSPVCSLQDPQSSVTITIIDTSSPCQSVPPWGSIRHSNQSDADLEFCVDQYCSSCIGVINSDYFDSNKCIMVSLSDVNSTNTYSIPSIVVKSALEITFPFDFNVLNHLKEIKVPAFAKPDPNDVIVSTLMISDNSSVSILMNNIGLPNVCNTDGETSDSSSGSGSSNSDLDGSSTVSMINSTVMQMYDCNLNCSCCATSGPNLTIGIVTQIDDGTQVLPLISRDVQFTIVGLGPMFSKTSLYWSFGILLISVLLLYGYRLYPVSRNLRRMKNAIINGVIGIAYPGFDPDDIQDFDFKNYFMSFLPRDRERSQVPPHFPGIVLGLLLAGVIQCANWYKSEPQAKFVNDIVTYMGMEDYIQTVDIFNFFSSW